MVKARLLAAVGILAVVGGIAGGLSAQTPAWPTFEVASVKPNKSGTVNSNVPLGPGGTSSPSGGLFAANQPLVVYILFAYNLLGNQMLYLLPQLPQWAQTDRYEIQARAAGNPSKDQMRLMMQALLADRFKLAIHHETRQVPVLAMVLAEPGKIGPQLRRHPDDASCPTIPTTSPGRFSDAGEGGFPTSCNGLSLMVPHQPDNERAGGRNLTMGFIAQNVTGMADLGRPVVDKTGLDGTFDFFLEWTPERTQPPGGSTDRSGGTTFLEALREQLGLKFESNTGPVDVLVIDHVEPPTPD